MEDTYHSICLDFLTVVTRFWFPWVMLLEMDAVKDSWDIDDERNDICQQKQLKGIGTMR